MLVKSNGSTAIPELLPLLDISGCIATIDAVGCHTDIAGQVVSQGGNCVLAVKDNQPYLRQDMELFFCLGQQDDFHEVAM